MWRLKRIFIKEELEEMPLPEEESLLSGEWQLIGKNTTTTESGDKIFTTVNNLPSKPQYNHSYLTEKLATLREEAELYQYESSFVSPNLLDESWFLEKMKSKMDELWKMLLVILFFGRTTQEISDGDWGGTEEIGYEEVASMIEEMSPWLKKTVMTNMLKKLEGQQNILQQKDISDEQWLVESLKVEGESLKTVLALLEDTQRDLCRPDELTIDPADPQAEEHKREYAKLYNQLFARKKRLEQIVKIYTNYITTAEQLYSAKRKLAQTSEEKVTRQVTDQFVFRHKGDPLLFGLEEQELEEKVKKACEPIQKEREELQESVEKLEKAKVEQTLHILDVQWVRFHAIELTPKVEPQKKNRSRAMTHPFPSGDWPRQKKQPAKAVEYYYCQLRKSTDKGKPDVREYYRVTVNKELLGLTIVPIDHTTVMSQLEGIDSTKRKEIITLLTQDPSERDVKLSSRHELLSEIPNLIALQQKIMRSAMPPEDKGLYDKCDLLRKSWFVEYTLDERGDACTDFPTLGLSVRHENLRQWNMKVGDYDGWKSDSKSWTGNRSQLGAKNFIYKNTIDKQKQTWKDAIDKDCYEKGYTRQTKANYDTILTALAQQLWLTYDPKNTTSQQVVRAYMYLKGAYGWEWMNTEYETGREWDKYWQYKNNGSDRRWILYCLSEGQRIDWLCSAHHDCSIPLIKFLW